jgi:phage nucleotide-binding protein
MSVNEPGQSLRDQLQVKSPEKIEYIKMLVFGESGAGKTTFLGTAQDSTLTSPVFLIDVEGGSVVLNDKPNVDVKQVRSTAGVEQIADILHKHPKYYATIELDSLTDFRDINMGEVMQEQYNKKPETTDKYVPSPREWGKSGGQIKEILRYLKDLPCHVIVTTLLEVKQDQRTGIEKMQPLLPGQLGRQVPGFFDIVGFLKATTKQGETIRSMQFKKTERVMAKDRTKALPDIMEEPTIPEIWDIIFKSGAMIDRTVAPELASVVALAKPTVAPTTT